MGRLRSLAGGASVGALTWTLAEYVVHRWVMHGPHTANPITAEHLDHHRELERTDPLRFDRFLIWPATGGLLVGSSAAVAVSAPAAVATGATFAACYCGYRQLHWAIHHQPPRTRWGRFLRRHHLRHHVGAPRSNHGITSPLWDLFLGTYRTDREPVRLPQAMAPRWLRREDGELDPRFAADYALR